ncbi:hypothetical protein EDD11_001066 [Mortierella claussenii]|nr:hypothetical protein EDD11_001066 [Mortierella claussenii]
MPISVRATFAQEGVFFAGEKLNCTITFTNSASPTITTSSVNGHHNSVLPPRPSSSLQHKLQLHYDHQQHHIESSSHGSGQRDQANAEATRDEHPVLPASSSSAVSSPNSPTGTDTKAQVRPDVSSMQSASPVTSNGVPQENGAKTHSRSDTPQQRPTTTASRALGQSRLSSDINHIEAVPRGGQLGLDDKESSQKQPPTADREQEDQEEREQTIAVPLGDGDGPARSPDSPTSQHQQRFQQQQFPLQNGQEDPQETISSPGLLGLASFVYRSTSFSSLVSAFGLSGTEAEQTQSNAHHTIEKKLPPLPPQDYLNPDRKQLPTTLPAVRIMSPENDEKVMKDSMDASDDVNGQSKEANADAGQLARLGTPIGLGFDNLQKSTHSRVPTNGSSSGLNEGMIELQVTDNADTQSVADDSEYQTPRPSMDYSTRSSMQSIRGPFQQQYFESPTRRSSLMSNYSVHSSPRGMLNPASKKESLLWGSVQVVGQFMVDGSFIKQQGFESLKTKTMYRPTGSSGGGAIGGGTLGTVTTSDWRDRANANRLFPVFSTPPSILFVDMQLAPGEATSYTYQIELPADLPPSHRGKTIRFAYNLVLGVQRGSVHTPAKSVQLPFRLYNNISEQGTRPVYDLMSPVILHKDTAVSSILGQGRTTEKTCENPKIARKQFEDYVDELIRNIQPSNEGFSPTQTRELTRRESDAYKDEETVLSHTCLEKAALLSRSMSAASYDICKNNVPVAKLSLIKTRFKLGETVHGIISFTARQIPTYQISVTLETLEAIEASYACRSAAQTSKLTKRVHAELHESCIDTMRTSFALCIPPTATPEFKTSTITLKWYIRVEFITGPADQPRFKMTSVDERRSQYQAVESLSTESFDCTVPIQVYPTSYETGALFPPSVAFSLV